MFIIGLYICSFPRARFAGPATPGFVWMSRLTDRETYWRGYGATLLIWAMNNEPLLQSPFTSSLFRYIGSISFLLYLVHGPVLHLLGYSLVLKLQKAMGGELGLALALVFLTPIVIWIADLFWRAVDKPCAYLVARVEALCSEDRQFNHHRVLWSLVVGTVFLTVLGSTTIHLLKNNHLQTAQTLSIPKENRGTSAIQARELRCRFDIMMNGWVPLACYNEALSEEYLSKSNFHFYTDTYAQDEVPLEIVRIGE